MKKWLSSTLVLLVSVLTFYGCGAGRQWRLITVTLCEIDNVCNMYDVDNGVSETLFTEYRALRRSRARNPMPLRTSCLTLAPHHAVKPWHAIKALE